MSRGGLGGSNRAFPQETEVCVTKADLFLTSPSYVTYVK